jgi:hypothetical protein
MSELESVRKFEYRPCRIVTGFNVEFVTAGEAIQGLCRDVSDSGIRARLDGSVSVGDCGLLILRHPAGVLEIEAQAAYIDKFQVGLEFRFKTSWERELTIEYIALIVSQSAESQVVPFP